MIPRGRIGKPLHIGKVTPLRREDLARLREPRSKSSRITRLRNSHHRVAILLAYGLGYDEIATITGYSYTRIASLAVDPMMQELTAGYRAKSREPVAEEQDEYIRLKTKNMIAAERHIADQIEELDEGNELMPIKVALEVSKDGADRLGYSKHTTQTNVNYDFATRLEKAIQRSSVLLEAPGLTAGALARGPAGPSKAMPVLLSFKRRL